ncbi:MAG: hypothetical protein WBX07_13155, partial [Rhodoplanes sp.]
TVGPHGATARLHRQTEGASAFIRFVLLHRFPQGWNAKAPVKTNIEAAVHKRARTALVESS